jgi:succinoglycan biosynthesis protein ExoA
MTTPPSAASGEISAMDAALVTTSNEAPKAIGAATLIIVPCLNEAAHLDRLLETLTADPGAQSARIAIVDGGSADHSFEIAQAWARRDRRAFALRNEKKLQAAALNLAVESLGAGVEFIIRVDAHATYPADFCARLLSAQAQTGADCVTVAMAARALGRGWFERANAAAQNSILGAGGAHHRREGKRRWVDHGHHALMRTALFRRVGGYDESFSHNEDAELDARFAKAGARILLAPDILVQYHPRTQARALWRQYFNFGKGRARTRLRHRQKLKWRQAAPLLVAPALLAAPGAWALPALGGPALAWSGLCLVYGVALGLSTRTPTAMLAGFPAMIMHSAWSFGFWRQTLWPGRAR